MFWDTKHKQLTHKLTKYRLLSLYTKKILSCFGKNSFVFPFAFNRKVFFVVHDENVKVTRNASGLWKLFFLLQKSILYINKISTFHKKMLQFWILKASQVSKRYKIFQFLKCVSVIKDYKLFFIFSLDVKWWYEGHIISFFIAKKTRLERNVDWCG